MESPEVSIRKVTVWKIGMPQQCLRFSFPFIDAAQEQCHQRARVPDPEWHG
ncbi:Uncharacterized protein DAT39_006814 [Clarias magur]|uniref:Uncharacterized protein n=1 Tax=Clarias magur TaxID=1594786 RepID=A0A8J4U3N0_CLAMG|nr:Uncharacterized protein DAT39_006814 [Clarias magur]